MDAAVCGARAGGDNAPCLGRQAIDPVAGRDRLAGRIEAETRPVAFGLVLLIGNRAFDDEKKWAYQPVGGAVKDVHEIRAVAIGKNGIMQSDAGYAGNGAE